ncbi:MAG: ABC transporter permease [Clostridiales bacterium]|nr:ABC transporter permease [Clostridiales bacterium]
MKKCLVLAQRNIKEMLRDPLSLVFCLGFPLVMLLLMQLIFTSLDFVPDNFQIKNYASGICVFGFTFTSLFVALQISSDKNSSFIKRINIAPISKATYYVSFFLSALPVVLVQTVLFFLIALCFGFPFDANFVLSIVYLLPSAALYVSIGILIGALSGNEKQTGPITSIFISLTGIFGGVFMPISLFGGGFGTFVNLLPFGHSVLIASELQTMGAGCIYPHILYLLGYIVAIIAAVAIIEKIRSVKR